MCFIFKRGMLWMSLKHKPVHIVSDHHAGVVPLDNEVSIEGDREVFVRHLWFQYHSRITMHLRRGQWNAAQCMMIEFWNLFESYLWDVFDVDPDIDNCRTLGRQFKLNVVLRHTDALCLRKKPLRKEER